MKYIPRINDSDDFPVYRTIDDFTLVGVRHSPPRKSFKNKRYQLTKVLDGGSYLLLEGDSKCSTLRRSVPYLSFEVFAENNFKKEKIYLEEGADYVQLAENFGISNNLFGVLDLARSLPDLVGKSKNGESLYHGLNKYLEFKKSGYPGFHVLDSNSIRDTFLRCMKKLEPDSFAEMAMIFHSYLARLRDYAYIGPNSADAKKLDGKKIILIGANHLDYLESWLKNIDVEVPLDWHSFVYTLPEKDVFKKLESLVLF